ncbi:MAG: 30S ribosomal protein S8 [Chitinivibrionales bacterium]|nr:30S ribosomal protein S8 [Chitinivibrionales bacterium]
MHSDQIADMLTRIRNAIHARKKTVTIPASKIKKHITEILYKNQYIAKYAFVEDKTQSVIKILLKYNDQLENAIQGLQRVSTPGRRIYSSADTLPKVLNGMGMCIVSTSKGLMTDQECKSVNMGGEVLAKVW